MTKFKQTPRKTIESTPIQSDKKRKTLERVVNTAVRNHAAKKDANGALSKRPRYKSAYIRTTFATALKQLREAENLSMDEVKKRTGIEKYMLSHWENGKNSITIDYIEKIAEGLGKRAEINFVNK